MKRRSEVCEKYETSEYQANKIQIRFEANKFLKRIWRTLSIGGHQHRP